MAIPNQPDETPDDNERDPFADFIGGLDMDLGSEEKHGTVPSDDLSEDETDIEDDVPNESQIDPMTALKIDGLVMDVTRDIQISRKAGRLEDGLTDIQSYIIGVGSAAISRNLTQERLASDKMVDLVRFVFICAWYIISYVINNLTQDGDIETPDGQQFESVSQIAVYIPDSVGTWRVARLHASFVQNSVYVTDSQQGVIVHTSLATSIKPTTDAERELYDALQAAHNNNIQWLIIHPPRED